MTDSFDDVLPEEDRDLEEIAHLLHSTRPLPSPTFRGALRRRLRSLRVPMSGRRLWPLVLSLAAAGVVCLGVIGLGLAGAGPLAPSHHGNQADRHLAPNKAAPPPTSPLKSSR